MRQLSLAGLLLCACAAPSPRPLAPSSVKLGVDVLEESGFAALRGKKIGLIANQTSKDSRGRSTIDVLAAAPGVTLATIFSPEHGVKGSADEKVSNDTLTVSHRVIPIVSLFRGGIKGMRPQQTDLVGLDALVIDIQDIGTRAYTYLATMGMALEEAQKAGIEFVVLDRPNPINGATMEGPVLDDLSLRKITPNAYFAVPVRHGMTIGEIARLHNAEVRSPKLTIVPMRGWKRPMWFDQTGLAWTAPSPNMPDLDAATMYPGIGIFESSNLAVGRGTPIPFRWVGAPWMDGDAVAKEMNAALLDGVEFSPQDFTPTRHVFIGQLCHGVRMRITDRDKLRPLDVFLKLNEVLMRRYPDQLQWRWDEVKREVGTDEFHRIIERGGDPLQLKALFDSGPEQFEKTRMPYLLY